MTPEAVTTSTQAASVLQVSSRPLARVPALPVAVFLSIGIAADRSLNLPVPLLLALTGLTCLGTCCSLKHSARATLLLLLTIAGIGAMRHHMVWSERPADSLLKVPMQDDSPVELTGVVASPVELRPVNRDQAASRGFTSDRTTLTLEASHLGQDPPLPVQGLVRVEIDGLVNTFQQGDTLRLTGRLKRPGQSRFEGSFDYPRWLRSQGINHVLSINHPEAIQKVEAPLQFRHRLARFRTACRERCRAVLTERLGPTTRDVGISLLLGTSTGMTEEIRDAFINSGTMHLLAISGLHVGILAGALFALARLMRLSIPFTVGFVLVMLWGYTFLTDMRPPVMRSVLLGSLIATALPSARNTNGLNLLAVSACILLLWSPNDLFDVGAQLSFLAVGAILWIWGLISRVHEQRRTGPDLPDPEGFYHQRLLPVLKKLGEGLLVTSAIWLFTLPLTMAWFQLISPVGLLVNVLLVPLSTPLLLTGFLTLASGLVSTWLAIIPGEAYNLCLWVLIAGVRFASNTPWGHLSVAGPGLMWLLGYYSLLAAALSLPTLRMKRTAWKCLAVMVTASLLWDLRPRPQGELQVTFIDVGHGGATLIEFPTGETALFDAGSFGNGRSAEQTIRKVLLSRRIPALNALILSHADSDHYNAAEELLENIPIGAIYVTHCFPDQKSAGIMEIFEQASRQNVPVRMLQAGDRIVFSPDTLCEVLHPAGTFRDRHDNANSLVLGLEYRDRKILLTGDLERNGTRRLMETMPATRIDVFQAPHHGSLRSNSSDLARWAVPRYVIACNRDDKTLDRLADVYPHADQILSSTGEGSVTARITSRGELMMTTTRNRQP